MSRLWSDYVVGKQSYSQLKKKYFLSVPTIVKHLDSVPFCLPTVRNQSLVLLADCVYFAHDFGVCVLRDSYTKENVWWQFVVKEEISVYCSGIRKLQEQGNKILGLVTDARNLSLGEVFPTIPVQMCQFHQIAIVRRRLTSKPRLDASKELKLLADNLTKLNEVKFNFIFEAWCNKWKEFLEEKTIDPVTKKWFFTHKRIRQARYSIRHHSKNLFIYLKHKHIKIPNTNNSIEATFTHLKDKVRLHRGLKLTRKLKLIHQILSN